MQSEYGSGDAQWWLQVVMSTTVGLHNWQLPHAAFLSSTDLGAARAAQASALHDLHCWTLPDPHNTPWVGLRAVNRRHAVRSQRQTQKHARADLFGDAGSAASCGALMVSPLVLGSLPAIGDPECVDEHGASG